MRGYATLLAILLLLAPLAAASDGSSGDGSSSSSSSSGPSPSGNQTDGNSTPPPPPPKPSCPLPDRQPSNESEVQACKERYCSEHPSDVRCQPSPSSRPGRKTGWERWCKDEASEDSARMRCRQDMAAFGPGQGEWVSFRVDAPNTTLVDYRVGGSLLLDSLHLESGSDNLTVERHGSTLRIGDEDTELVLHDDPTGLIGFKGADGSATLVFPADAKVQRATDGSVARIALPDGRMATFRSDNATWLDDHTILVGGFFALLLPPPEHKDGHDSAVQGEVKQAIVDRKVGAEITLKAPPSPGRAATAQENGSVQVLAYDDVSVQVRMPPRLATQDSPIRVELSAGLHEGRTIVLNLNRSLLLNSDPGSLVLRYYDVTEQADGSTLESEVVFHQASSLQDVLDPSDDNGQPEYWVVQDANGLQAMITVPHWSVHAITVASIAQALEQPNVQYGLVAGSVGTMLAAVAMLWPRRRDEF
jgi:hypothetical protein